MSATCQELLQQLRDTHDADDDAHMHEYLTEEGTGT